MKKLVFAVAFVMGIIPAFAQTTAPGPKTTSNQKDAPPANQTAKPMPSPEQRAVSYSKELKQKLALTDDQYSKILAVNTECIRRKDALKASGQKGGQGAKDISTYRQQQYQTILTPDQQTKLKEMNSAGGVQTNSTKPGAN